jgi:hypothetical protein
VATTWEQQDGDLEVSLAREDRDNRPTMVTIRDRYMEVEIVIQPHDAEWLSERLKDAIAAAGEHHADDLPA